MLVSGGNISRFIGRNEQIMLAINYLRHPAHHDPVLASMVMHLQRK